MTTNQKEE